MTIIIGMENARIRRRLLHMRFPQVQTREPHTSRQAANLLFRRVAVVFVKVMIPDSRVTTVHSLCARARVPDESPA